MPDFTQKRITWQEFIQFVSEYDKLAEPRYFVHMQQPSTRRRVKRKGFIMGGFLDDVLVSVCVFTETGYGGWLILDYIYTIEQYRKQHYATRLLLSFGPTCARSSPMNLYLQYVGFTKHGDMYCYSSVPAQERTLKKLSKMVNKY